MLELPITPECSVASSLSMADAASLIAACGILHPVLTRAVNWLSGGRRSELSNESAQWILREFEALFAAACNRARIAFVGLGMQEMRLPNASFERGHRVISLKRDVINKGLTNGLGGRFRCNARYSWAPGDLDWNLRGTHNSATWPWGPDDYGKVDMVFVPKDPGIFPGITAAFVRSDSENPVVISSLAMYNVLATDAEILDAVETGDVKRTLGLIREGRGSAGDRDAKGRSLLSIAKERGDWNMYQLLIMKGATPLHDLPECMSEVLELPQPTA
ncbi:hypothetical protein BDY21DRAFT_334006 [Lineolata rhizophorae]|uniref:Ankyrin repeat-containing domain protein n=1 Tax=Lineolata rhizophorae TaxID=578093 RepID=A0A6A6PAN4_9PEZI|nr:hypothetical protein BDY21DRAFT_334006 [Lineolata rhizophorae]